MSDGGRTEETGIAEWFSKFFLPLFVGTDTVESIKCYPGLFYRACEFKDDAQREDYNIEES